ncbi:MAG TPA: hypothetical protein VIB39_15580 [Candidatus Angelobacter sp.]|jgi:hypothetical protein
MERVCKACFDKQYADSKASPAPGWQLKDLPVPIMVGLLIAALWYEGMLHFPKQLTALYHGYGLGMKVLQTAFAVMGTALGIVDSLKWRSGQNLLFWVLASLNIVAVVMCWLQGGAGWLAFVVFTYLLNKGLSFYWGRRTV